MKTELSQDVVQELVKYDPITGYFTWRKPGLGRRKGAMGTVNPMGYRYITITVRPLELPQKILAHRLAWIYTYGSLDNEIDHINGNKDDNSISNLREVSRAGNQQNFRKARSDNALGVLGVSWRKDKQKYRARIVVEGKETHIGYFDTLKEASAAYLRTKRLYHPTCTI